MYYQSFSAALVGLDAIPIRVEADVSDGLPIFQMVGFLSSEAKEAKERTRSSLKNAGYRIPAKRITVNLSPADIRKDGTAFDLAIALALLAAFGALDGKSLERHLIVGELSLDGRVNAVNGVLPIVLAAKQAGFMRCLVPEGNLTEAMIVQGIEIMGVRSLADAVRVIDQEKEWKPAQSVCEKQAECHAAEVLDYIDVYGQTAAKRAIEVAVAGMHNLLLIGPPGSGKSMLANRIPGIMPPLELAESLEITKVYSVCGLLPEGISRIVQRPFRAPYHTITPPALLGGGKTPRPGEISLANGGVLFLDEFAEFNPHTIEMLRQPLENRNVVINRLHGTYSFPCNFMLVAAMNACQCGYYPDRGRCRCTQSQIQHYLGKLSKPLLDRIDIMAETIRCDYATIRLDERKKQRSKGENNSAEIRKRILRAREFQANRYQGTTIHYNCDLTIEQLRIYAKLDYEGERVMKLAYRQMELSGRGYHRVLRVARTIADLGGEEQIQKKHLIEAIGYRQLEQKYWEA